MWFKCCAIYNIHVGWLNVMNQPAYGVSKL